MNYYTCLVNHEKNNGVSHKVFLITGRTEIKNNKLYMYDLNASCSGDKMFNKSYYKLRFSNFLNGSKATPEIFFACMNNLFGTYAKAVYLSDELADKIVQYNNGYTDKEPLHGIFDLNDMTCKLMYVYGKDNFVYRI
jgi:hypothetical protein